MAEYADPSAPVHAPSPMAAVGSASPGDEAAEHEHRQYRDGLLGQAVSAPSAAVAACAADVAALVRLNNVGLSDSVEADVLRDALDVRWYRMSGASQAHVRALIAWVEESFDTTGHDPGDEDR